MYVHVMYVKRMIVVEANADPAGRVGGRGGQAQAWADADADADADASGYGMRYRLHRRPVDARER